MCYVVVKIKCEHCHHEHDSDHEEITKNDYENMTAAGAAASNFGKNGVTSDDNVFYPAHMIKSAKAFEGSPPV